MSERSPPNWLTGPDVASYLEDVTQGQRQIAAWATLAALVLVVLTGHFVWLIIAAIIVVPVLVLLVALARFFDLTVFRR